MTNRFRVVESPANDKYYVIDSPNWGGPSRGIGTLDAIPLTYRQLADQVCDNLNEQVRSKQ